MKTTLLIAFLALTSAASAQKLAWKVEIPNIEAISQVAPDGVGGGVAIVRDAEGDHKVLWFSNKGVKKAEFTIIAPAAADLTGPLMVTATRFYLLVSNAETTELRRYTLGKKGAPVSVTSTTIKEAEGEWFSAAADSDKTGFFVYSRDVTGGTGHITRYAH